MSRLCEHKGLVVVLVAFLALGALYLRVTPLLETPDEPAHFSVVKYIADEARLPPWRPGPEKVSPAPIVLPGAPIYYAPPLYYALGALLIADLDTGGFAQAVTPNPNWARGWAPTPGRSPENKNIYVHTAAQRPPYAGWATAMRRVRLFSLLLGGATVVGVYALARTLWPRPADQSWALAATALVAFNPAFLFVTIGVTNDALLAALSAWAFVLMVWLIDIGYWRLSPNGEAGPSPPWGGLRGGMGLVTLLGILLGLGALTKQSALAFLPLGALVVVWGARLRACSWRTALRWLLLWAALVALVGGWWYLHNGLIYGDPLGFQPHRPPTEAWRPSLSLLARQLGSALQSYGGTFAGVILVERAIYVAMALFALIGSLGWLRWRTREGGRIVAVLGLGVFLNLVGLVLWLLRTAAPYGRLLFPSLGPVAVLLVMGWQNGLGEKYRRVFAWIVALAMGSYALVVPWRYLRPAYVHPVVSPSAVEGATALDVQFDQAVSLLAYRMRPETAGPGEQVTLTLYWQTTAALEKDWTVFVQLAPRDPQQRVSGLDAYLGGTRYPSSAWQAGEVIRQEHRLWLPGDVPVPALYWFTVGLYAAPGAERLPLRADGESQPGGVVRLGPLRALSEQVARPRQPVDYRFGSAIQLTGYEVDLAQAASLTLTLYWQASAAPDGHWTVFVHLLDAGGNAVAQHDARPCQGDYPTWAWQAGDRVADPHTLPLPPDLPPGSYRLLVGLYRPGDGVRMPIFDRQGEPLPDAVLPLGDVNLSGGQ
jgi:4-amino-4-deoxy-L-arabinose transferase-like glycosyltransferase